AALGVELVGRQEQDVARSARAAEDRELPPLRAGREAALRRRHEAVACRDLLDPEADGLAGDVGPKRAAKTVGRARACGRNRAREVDREELRDPTERDAHGELARDQLVREREPRVARE